jgi:hypothetical protein
LASECRFHGETSTYLRRHETLKKIELKLKSSGAPHFLYHDTKRNPGTISVWDIALSLHVDSYITGYTALSLLGWTEYSPTKIYINWIRSTKDKFTVIHDPIKNETLQQAAYTTKKEPPVLLSFDDKEIVFLSGQIFSPEEKTHLIPFASELELPPYALTFQEERLFLEALINYHWFGGADIVWQALTSRARSLNQNKLIEVYKEMKLQYPYANAIGYILERCNTSKTVLARWASLVNSDLQFHLFMGDSERRVFVDKWSVYVPKRFYQKGD